MAIVEKKLTWTVKSKLENDKEQVIVNLVATTPEGVFYSSPGEGIFITIPKAECILEVGQVIEGITVAQYEDGVTP